jgi:hypothetical protein
MNNPLLYNDPSGEIFVVDDVLIMAAIYGAMAGYLSCVITALVTGHAVSGGQVLKSMFMGALSGVITAGIVGGPIFAGSGFFAMVGNGAITGAIGGGVNALLNGQDFFKGVATGAILGGAMGAISYTINFYSHGSSHKLKEADLGEVTSGEGFEKSTDPDVLN